MDPSYFSFWKDAKERCNTHNERYGQALFNHLLIVRPDLAEQIRGTENDPYHFNRCSPQFKRFVSFIEENWHKNNEKSSMTTSQEEVMNLFSWAVKRMFTEKQRKDQFNPILKEISNDPNLAKDFILALTK